MLFELVRISRQFASLNVSVNHFVYSKRHLGLSVIYSDCDLFLQVMFSIFKSRSDFRIRSR